MQVSPDKSSLRGISLRRDRVNHIGVRGEWSSVASSLPMFVMSAVYYFSRYTRDVRAPNIKFLIVGIAIVAVAIGYVVFLYSSEPKFTYTSVMRGEIVQEISASGNVEPPTQVNLHFKNAGKLVARGVEIGDMVEEGEVLARQDASELSAQLREVEAGVDVQQAKLAQLLAGAAAEDIRSAETDVANAKIAVEDEKEAAVKAMQDAYTKSDDAVRTKADVVFVNPRTAPEFNFVISDQRIEMSAESARAAVEKNLKMWNASVAALDSSSDLHAYVRDSETYLRAVTTLLDYIAQTLNLHVTNLSQTTLDTWKASVSTARTNVNTASSALTAASESLKAAEGALTSAEDALASKKAPARTADVALNEAQIRQAGAGMARIEALIDETRLVAPIGGLVTKVDGDVGEIIGSDATVVSITPVGGLQIKLNVSENNIVDVRVGQKARIILDSFGNDTEWEGSVIAVEPAETVIGGAVYYKTTVLSDSQDDRIRSGMTANVWITTATKEDAFSVPASAIHIRPTGLSTSSLDARSEERDGKKYVRVHTGRNGNVTERVVTTGIMGKEGVVEIVEGLSEGEQVVTGQGI